MFFIGGRGDGDGKSGDNALVNDERREILSGWLWKEGGGWSSRWRRRWFVLRDDATLTYYTSGENVSSQSLKGCIRIGATRCVLDTVNGSRQYKQHYRPVLHLYTVNKSYHFETDLASEPGQQIEDELLVLKQWAFHLLAVSGRKSQEFSAANVIRSTWASYRSGPRFGTTVRNHALEKVPTRNVGVTHDGDGEMNTVEVETPALIYHPRRHRDSPRQISLEFESQAKLLLQRPRTGASSILIRSSTIRNRGLCWQVLLGCAEYSGDDDALVDDGKTASPTVRYSRHWEKTTRFEYEAYQRRLIRLRDWDKVPIHGNHADVKGHTQDDPEAETREMLSSRQTAVYDPLSIQAETSFKMQNHIANLRKEIWNDVNRTFPEDPFFLLPRVKGMMRRILFAWCQSEENKTAQRIGYRQGMNSLLAVLLLVHVRDAEAKGRALRCYLTGTVGKSLVNRIHAELLRSTGYRFPTQLQMKEEEKSNIHGSSNALEFFGDGIPANKSCSSVEESTRRSLSFRSFRYRPAGWLLKPDFKRSDQRSGGDSSVSGKRYLSERRPSLTQKAKRKLARAREALTGEPFRRRWFLLHPESNIIYYFHNPKHAEEYLQICKTKSTETATTSEESTDPTSHSTLPLGSIDLSKVVAIRESSVKDAPYEANFAFDLISPDRKWTLSAENESSASCWVHAIVTSLHWGDKLGPDILHTRSSHLRRSQVGSATTDKDDEQDSNDYEDKLIRECLLVVESTEMAESQSLRSLRGLLGPVRNSSVGRFSVCELFDFYTEGDDRSRSNGVSRFEKEASRTFLSSMSPGNTYSSQHQLPLLRLCNHIQYVILKNVDPELYRHFHKLGIEPQLYGLKWLRCLFSNVLTAVDFQNDEEEDLDHETDNNPSDEDAKSRAHQPKLTFASARMGPPADLPLKHVLTVWDAMLGCKDRLFDFVEAFCIALIITIRTPLLLADTNEILMLLMRYSLSTVCQSRIRDAKTILALGSSPNLLESLGSENSAVSGLVEIAMQLVEHGDWPNLRQISVEQLMRTWVEPVSLRLESSKVRSLVTDRQKRAASTISHDKLEEQLDHDLKSVLTLEQRDASDVKEAIAYRPLRGASGGYGVDEPLKEGK